MTYGSLPDLWREHQHAAFPASCLKQSFRDRPLVKLDAAVGALLTASLGRDGVARDLPPEKREELRNLLELLRELDVDLEDSARRYFDRLRGLAEAVLKA